MTVKQLRKAIEVIGEVAKPENPNGLIIIYDHWIRGDSEKIRPGSILEINGKDVSHLSNEKKKKRYLLSMFIFIYPRKNHIQGGTCDYPTT